MRQHRLKIADVCAGRGSGTTAVLSLSQNPVLIRGTSAAAMAARAAAGARAAAAAAAAAVVAATAAPGPRPIQVLLLLSYRPTAPKAATVLSHSIPMRISTRIAFALRLHCAYRGRCARPWSGSALRLLQSTIGSALLSERAKPLNTRHALQLPFPIEYAWRSLRARQSSTRTRLGRQRVTASASR